MTHLPIILASLPFVVFIILLLTNKTTLLKASLVALILYTVIALFFFKMFPEFLLISYGKGFFVAIDILGSIKATFEIWIGNSF